MTFKRSTLRFCALATLRSAELGRHVAAALALTFALVGSAQAQAYANVTVGGAFAPGIFGQISMGNNPPPPVYNVQPVIVGSPVYGATPLYLYVSQQEYRYWAHHCARYRACGRPVHFVRVERNNPWWERHGGYYPGHGYYRHPHAWHDDRRGAHGREHRPEYNNIRRDDYRDPRHESRRGER